MALSLHQTALVDFGSLAIANYPFTMVGWFRVPSVSALLTLMRIDNTVTTSYHALVYEGHSAGQVAAVSKVSVTGAARTTIAMTPGQWQHVAGVFEAFDSRRVYLNGGNMGSNAALRTFDGANQFRAGNISTANGVDTAEVAIFSSVLSADEIGILAKGCSVLSLLKANNLLTYQYLLRGVNRSGMGPIASVSGSPTVVDHPRMLMTSGGRTLAQPCRACGPFQVDQESFRTSFADPGQVSIAGTSDEAGLVAIAGIDSHNSRFSGEVHL